MLRAAGVTLARIIGAVMKSGLLLAVLAVLLGEWVAPPAEKAAQIMRSGALNNTITVTSQAGFWARDGENFVQVNDIFSDSALGGVTIYAMEGYQLREVISAKVANYVDNQWLLGGVQRSRLSESGVVTETRQELPWRSLLNPDLIGVVAVKPEFLSAWGLWQYVAFLDENGLDAGRYKQAFWKKIVSPLATAVMVFLAIPFVFGPLRSVTAGQRVVVGTFVGIGFYLVNEVFGFVGLVYGLNPLMSALLPTLLFFGLGLYLTRRILCVCGGCWL